jgi:hypothetical protein
MSEEAVERAVQQALAREGIDEQVLAAGQFNPRGHTGSMFVGGLAGGEAGELGGSVGEAVGDVAGAAGGMRANAASSGMPQWMWSASRPMRSTDSTGGPVAGCRASSSSRPTGPGST